MLGSTPENDRRPEKLNRPNSGRLKTTKSRNNDLFQQLDVFGQSELGLLKSRIPYPEINIIINNN